MTSTITWTAVGPASHFLIDAGTAVKVGGETIAVFRYGADRWYAVQNRCPHEGISALSRGLVGDKNGEPKVACPLHKNAFSLEDGRHLGGNEAWCLKTYPVRLEHGQVLVGIEET
jgi:nitrite reductase (NADH) small subunit